MNKKQIIIAGVLLIVIGITSLVFFIRLLYMEDKISTSNYSVQEYSKRLTLIYVDLIKKSKGKIDNFIIQSSIINQINNQISIIRYQFTNTVRMIICKIEDCEKDPLANISSILNSIH